MGHLSDAVVLGSSRGQLLAPPSWHLYHQAVDRHKHTPPRPVLGQPANEMGWNQLLGQGRPVWTVRGRTCSRGALSFRNQVTTEHQPPVTSSSGGSLASRIRVLSAGVR